MLDGVFHFGLGILNLVLTSFYIDVRFGSDKKIGF